VKRRYSFEPTNKVDVEALQRQIAKLQAEVAAAKEARSNPSKEWPAPRKLRRNEVESVA
jgi:hypothetical protein